MTLKYRIILYLLMFNGKTIKTFIYLIQFKIDSITPILVAVPTKIYITF